MTSIIRRNVEPHRPEPGRRTYFEVFADVEYLAAEYERLQNDYPDQWVAIVGQKVVATSTELDELFQQLDALCLRDQSPITEFFESDPPIRI